MRAARGTYLNRKEFLRQWRKRPKQKAKAVRWQRKLAWKARLACLRHYGGDPPRCACCGETEIGFLTLDHVNNDGSTHRKIARGRLPFVWLMQKDFPCDPPLRVLCYNCNMGRERNSGICPHKIPLTFQTWGQSHRKKPDGQTSLFVE